MKTTMNETAFTASYGEVTERLPFDFLVNGLEPRLNAIHDQLREQHIKLHRAAADAARFLTEDHRNLSAAAYLAQVAAVARAQSETLQQMAVAVVHGAAGAGTDTRPVAELIRKIDDIASEIADLYRRFNALYTGNAALIRRDTRPVTVPAGVA